MQATLKLKISEIFSKYHFSKEDASFISEVLSEIDAKQDEKFQLSKELFLTQRDKTEIIERIEGLNSSFHKTIYTVGIIQFLAIIGSILAIMNYMHK